MTPSITVPGSPSVAVPDGVPGTRNGISPGTAPGVSPATVGPDGAGLHLRIVSPAMPTLSYLPDRVRRAERALTAAGYTFSYGANAFQVAADGITAGTPAQRAADVMAAFADPSVDAILAADAGLGTRDILDRLDAATIAANPKPFIGYCDNVFLNQYLASVAGIGSLYGCTLMVHLGEAGGAYPETLDHLGRALSGAGPLACPPMPSRTGEVIDWYVPERESRPRRRLPGGWTWLRPGAGRGPFLGGEITLIPELVRSFGMSLDGAVLFWDVSYHRLPVPPLFEKLCESADLGRLAGMVVGAHPLVPDGEWAATVAGLLDRHLPWADFPVLANADLSHLCPSWTVPFGAEAVLASPGGLVFPRGHDAAGPVAAPAVPAARTAASGR
ncbi:hypothetical protein Sru01_15680 [Sphaerisporangium rufum]|uniref:LD-carboxypeptidase n=1 Tax=Sphaerisporangium rufum TaxID=1381558 RepID=A0A919UX23_9ACTN|nr:LD-carboxypeptidase [Sphaerisporangium rufum]GII76586.1 hypothetical protein Sru01_15680 [Sphaerisporangium rufum]